MSSVITCLIVKDEAPVIRRCLDSVRAVTDHLLVCDTGSEDGTPSLVREWMAESGTPGEVITLPWVDFATNRTLLLESARRPAACEYVFTLDADEVLETAPGWTKDTFRAQLTHDCHSVPVRSGSILYPRPLLFRNATPFRYRGVVHEALYCDPPHTRGPAVTGLQVRALADGARSLAGGKFLRDIALLEGALASGADPDLRARYLFYLAQSRRDAGQHEAALATYYLREREGGWAEEVFQSIYQQGRLMEALERPAGAVIQRYTDAWERLPSRAESLHAAARLCNRTGRFRQAYLLASAAEPIPLREGLFVEDWIYRYGVLDELAIAAQRTGRLKEAARINRLLLRIIPQDQHDRIRKNLAFCGK